jgi:murein L,D-transpeptidase YafK
MTDSFIRWFGRLFLYRIKAMENAWHTWKNRRDIDRAYTGAPDFTGHVKKWMPGIAVSVVVAAAVIILSLLATPYVRRGAVKAAAALRQHSANAGERNARKKAGDAKRAISGGRAAVPAQPELPVADRNVLPDVNPLEYVLLANTVDRKMYVLARREGEWKEIRRFEMAIGENGDTKQHAGDKRTPVGLYFIVGQKTPAEMAEIYGPVAYVLNYPNKADIEAGRTGRGIWIHGTAPDSMPVNTRGCMELHNRDLRDLVSLIGMGIAVPVIIRNMASSEPATGLPWAEIAGERRALLDDYEGKKKLFTGLLVQWVQAWESRDIGRYESFYHTADFRGQGVSWESWREKKRRTFELYKSIDVTIDNMVLSDFSGSSAVVKFIQEYTSDAVKVRNGKRLVLAKVGDGWKISCEESLPQEEIL